MVENNLEFKEKMYISTDLGGTLCGGLRDHLKEF